jgi:DNA-binding CsgD family transcriptional regulator
VCSGICQIASTRRSQARTSDMLLPLAEGGRTRELSEWARHQGCTDELAGGGSHVTAKRGEARGLHIAGALRLTPREIECLEWLGRGLRVGGIGSKLGIGVPTVATHLSGARKKLGAATREQALVLALRHGLIDP